MIEDLQRKLNEKADAKCGAFQKTQEQLIISAVNALNVSPYVNIKDILKLSSSPDNIDLYYFIELVKKLGEKDLVANYREAETEAFLKSVEDTKTQLEQLQQQVDSLSQ